MHDHATLSVEILSYWHPGTGRGSSHYLDALPNTDADGLPHLPGRTLKGLVRDGLQRAEAWGRLPAGATVALCGSHEDKTHFSPQAARQGALQFGNAQLPAALRQWLGQPAQAGHRQALFRDLFATAVEHERGTAQEQSLRGLRVVVPLTLTAAITLQPEAPQDNLVREWVQHLRTVLPLIRAVGGHRSRGLGRAVLTLQSDGEPRP